jgi:spermidine/putrescine-binding protein
MMRSSAESLTLTSRIDQSLFSIPKNAPNKEGAYAYLNAVLEPQAQIISG